MDQALGQIVGKIDAGQKIGPGKRRDFSGKEKGLCQLSLIDGI